MEKNKEKKRLLLLHQISKKKLILALFKKLKIKNHFLFRKIKKILLDQKTLEVLIYHQKQT